MVAPSSLPVGSLLVALFVGFNIGESSTSVAFGPVGSFVLFEFTLVLGG